MPRVQWNEGDEIKYQDLNRTAMQHEREIYERVYYEILNRRTNAFFGPSFLVTRVDDTTLQIAAGSGFQRDEDIVHPESKVRLLWLPANVEEQIDAADDTDNRIDIVCVRHGRATSSTGSRKVKNFTTGQVASQTVNIETDWSTEYQIVAGTPDAAPVAPATPTGWLKIADVLVTATVGIDSADHVTDTRAKLPLATFGGVDPAVPVSSTYQVLVGDTLQLDASAGPFTIALPLAPQAGDRFECYDKYFDDGGANLALSLAVNNVTVDRNGSKINGAAEDLILDIPGGRMTFIYSGTDLGWRVY